MNITQNLERSFKVFVDQEKPFDFFKGLIQYLEYVFSIPILKKVFDKQMDERRILYKQIEDIEKKSRKELDQAKSKLLSLIKKTKIDTKTFVRHRTWPYDADILHELDAVENPKKEGRRTVGGTFMSDDIEGYLFDIAENLLRAGYKKELKNFIVSQREYTEYQYRIHGSVNFHPGNLYGKFIFSKTWPERWEKVACFEHERILKPWGSFEKLLQFMTAYMLALVKNISIEPILGKGTEPTPWFGGIRESLHIFDMARELQPLIEDGLDFYSQVSFPHIKHNSRLEKIKQGDIKTAVQTVHGQLISIAEQEDDEEKATNTKQFTKITIYYELDYGFYRDGERDKIYQITSDRKGNKSFKMILTLNDKGKLRASKLGQEIGCNMKKISDMRTRINKQFHKHCRINNVIAYKNFQYEINDNFVIKQA